MNSWIHTSKRLIDLSKPAASKQWRRSLASKIEIPFTPPPFSVIDTCPSATCPCRDTPQGLDIEQEQNLNGSMAAYAEQVLVCTGKSDWSSRIENDPDGDLVRQLKNLLGPKGKYSDPFHNVLLTHSSFPPTRTHSHQSSNAPLTPTIDHDALVQSSSSITTPFASAFLLPSFQYIPSISTAPATVETMIKAFILPSQLHQAHNRLPRQQQNVLLRRPELQRAFPGARRAKEILILICSHQSRDSRCGTIAPILRDEFRDKLHRMGIPVLTEPPAAEVEAVDEAVRGYTPHARIGLISHIGGHKWAGNVIIYIPPEFEENELAGDGIWYGRVGPQHVEGIVEKTILGGKVIRDMFRGGINRERKILRL